MLLSYLTIQIDDKGAGERLNIGPQATGREYRWQDPSFKGCDKYPKDLH